MNERDLRRQLTIVVYSLIFKRILPTMDGAYKIGNIEYATRLNQLMKQRALTGYTDTPFDDFNLIITDEAMTFVKDSNFNNWVNGTSNPKSYGIINALLEYVYETCQAEDKFMQLKLELLGIIQQDAFALYSNHLIDNMISHWSNHLKNEVTLQDVLRMLKDILYLLKDKNRHMSYLMHNQNVVTIDLPQLAPEEIEPELSTFALSQKLRKTLGFASLAATVALTLIVLLVLVLTNLTNKKLPQTPKDVIEIADESQVYAAQTLENSQENTALDMPAVLAIPTDIELTKPVLNSPQPDSILPYSALDISWQPVEAATAYDVVFKHTRTDTIVYEANGVTDTALNVDAKYFLHGNQYQLYVIARKDWSSSEAAILSFNIEALPAPKIVTEPDKSPVPLANITVSWLPVAGADTYQIVVTDMERWVKVFEKNYINQTTYTLDRSLFYPGIEYRVYIASQNSSAISEPNYMDIKIATLETPKITSPLNNSKIDSDILTLKWEPVEFATSYNINILETNTWETVYSYEGQKETTMNIDPTRFKVGGKYRIYLFAMFGNSSSHPAYLDLSAADLLSPKILSPSNNAKLPLADVTISWEPNPIAHYYKVVVTNTITWESVVTFERVDDNAITLEKANLNIDNPYRIYVSSFSNALKSAPNYIDIRIEGLPTPKILSPLHQTQYENQQIKIEWAPNPYISTYKVTVTDLSTWTNVYTNASVLAEDIILDKSLLTQGSSYRVYVQSVMGTMESEPAYVDFKMK